MLPVLGGFDKSNYKTERLWATAEDGTKVPISLVYRPDMVQKDGNNPCLLYACASCPLEGDRCVPYSLSFHVFNSCRHVSEADA